MAEPEDCWCCGEPGCDCEPGGDCEPGASPLVNHPGLHDLMALTFERLPFRFIGLIGQVCTLWRRFAQDTFWMRQRVLFSFGDGDANGHGRGYLAGPRLLTGLSMEHVVRSVVCTQRTSFVLTAPAAGWWFGAGWLAQMPDQLEPAPLSLGGPGIVQLAASAPGYYHGRKDHHYHVLCLGTDQRLYAWGQNRCGQCLLPEPRQLPEPVPVPGPDGERVTAISCGGEFSMLLTQHKSQQRCWLAGHYSCFGRVVGPLRPVELPQPQPPLSPDPIRSIQCGGFFAALLSRAGRLWTVGSTIGRDQSNGNLLATGQPGQAELVQTPVRARTGLSPEPSFESVRCSSYSAVAISSDRRAFTWGDRDGHSLGRSTGPAASGDSPAPLDGWLAGPVANAAVSYTNGGVVTPEGAVYVWGGASWGGGVGRGEHTAAQVTWSEGLSGVPRCYQCDDLAMGSDHVILTFVKKASSA